MLKIRFFRVGKKKQPSFKVVVTEKSSPPRGGRFIEEVGFWNPLTKEKILRAERIKYWLSKGAKPSDSVYNLLIKEKVLEGKKIPLHKIKKKKEKPASVPLSGATEDKKAAAGKEEKKEEVKKEVKEVKKEEIKKEAKKSEEVKSVGGDEKPKKEEVKEEKT